MEMMRNLWRRKLRTALTVSGIVMGIFALTTMGALAEHFNVLLGGGITYYSSSIQVASDTGGGSFGGGYMSLDTVKKIKLVDGVMAVGPTVQVLAKPGSVQAVNFGVPDYIMNYDPASFKYSAFKVTLASGQWPGDASRYSVTLGSSFAAEFRKHVGDVINLPVRPSDATAGFINHQFTVIGVLNQTLTAPDSGAFVSLHDAQMLM